MKVLLIVALLFLLGCQTTPEPSATPKPQTLRFYNWEDDLPQSVLDDFRAETGITVEYLIYEAVSEASYNVRAGQPYDVAVLDNEIIPSLIEADALYLLKLQDLPNLRNIDPAFRDLYYDPGNLHCVPFNWGTTGLLVKSSQVEQVPQRWSDLWSGDYQIILPHDTRLLMSISLLTLGYSINETDPLALAEAEEHLVALRPSIVEVSTASSDSADAEEFVNGSATVKVGWPGTALAAQTLDEDILYILPEEGTLLWGDNFCIPAAAQAPELAHEFINYLMRADVSAEIATHNSYPIANLAARDLLDYDLRNNPIIYPENSQLTNAAIFEPILPQEESAIEAAVRTALGEIFVP